MLGLMQQWPLTVDKILDHAARWHGAREIVTRANDGSIVRIDYARAHGRARRLSSALRGLGVESGMRVATLAWNTARHLEAWYAIMGMGAVCHTLNPRLPIGQLVWIANHARDRIIFVDADLAPIVENMLPQLSTVEHVIVMSDGDRPNSSLARGSPLSKGWLDFETLIGANESTATWGGFGEDHACGLCYTSGTTGDPKGVLYSHRSNFLHALVTLQKDVIGLGARDVVLPIVPMFHANSWGLAFSAPAVGAKLVMPGNKLDGASLYELMQAEGVTFAAGVPTIWHGLLTYLAKSKLKPASLQRIVVGGSACPASMIECFGEEYGVEVVHAWGMTETSPVGTAFSPLAGFDALDGVERSRLRLTQGRPSIGIDLKLSDEAGDDVPHDGKRFGHLRVKGPYVAGAYYDSPLPALGDDGYFDTGDVATIDPSGFMRITDRLKDVIKSGGEWISSIEIENLAATHPKTALAAVIGVTHSKWGERPLLIVKLAEGQRADRIEYLEFLAGKIPQWWMPDDIQFVDDLPLGATGKIDKKALRAQFGGSIGQSAPTQGATRANAGESQ